MGETSLSTLTFARGSSPSWSISPCRFQKHVVVQHSLQVFRPSLPIGSERITPKSSLTASLQTLLVAFRTLFAARKNLIPADCTMLRVFIFSVYFAVSTTVKESANLYCLVESYFRSFHGFVFQSTSGCAPTIVENTMPEQHTSSIPVS